AEAAEGAARGWALPNRNHHRQPPAGMTRLTTRPPPPKLITRGPARVQPETARWLNQSRGSFGAAHRRFNDIASMDVTGAGALFMSAEYPVNAVILEHSGRPPPSLATHWIVNLSHRIGLWSGKLTF